MGLALLVPVVLTFGPAAVQAQDAAAGEKVFAVCKACHQVGENAKMRWVPPERRHRTALGIRGGL
jgi:cytochrome c2